MPVLSGVPPTPNLTQNDYTDLTSLQIATADLKVALGTAGPSGVSSSYAIPVTGASQGIISSGDLVIELQFGTTNDLALINGPLRAIQDVTLWLLTPQGSDPFDPLWGNPLFSLLGSPSRQDYAELVTAMLDEAEADFIRRHEQDAQYGYVSTREQIIAIDLVSVNQLGPSPAGYAGVQPLALTVEFMVTVKSAETITTNTILRRGM